MEKEKWYPTKNQEGQVENLEKANEMAVVEETARTAAKEYEKYLQDPEAYTEERSWNIFDQTARSFKGLNEAGVTPEILQKLGEKEAEAAGEVHDYKESLKDKSNAQLLMEGVNQWTQNIFYEFMMRKEFSGKHYGPFDKFAGVAESTEFQNLRIRHHMTESKMDAVIEALADKNEKE